MDPTFISTSIFPFQKENKKEKDYFLEFRQLKEYYNFQRKFRATRKDENMIGKVFQNDYYLIDKRWLDKWKECVGYNDFLKANINRELEDKDYDLFIKLLPKNIKEIRHFPLDNSNIYFKNGDINPLSEFIIINKQCHKVFEESRKNMNYIDNERSRPLQFLKNKIILTITENSRIIYFKNEKNVDEEIIIIFLKNDYKSTILTEIIKAENFKYWLKDKSFDLDTLDELEVEGFGYKIINKKLKLKSKLNFNSVNPSTIASNTTLLKCNLPKNLKAQIQSQQYEIFEKTGAIPFVGQNNNNKPQVFRNENNINNNNNNNNNFNNNNNEQNNFNQMENPIFNINNQPNNINNNQFNNNNFNNNPNNNININNINGNFNNYRNISSNMNNNQINNQMGNNQMNFPQQNFNPQMQVMNNWGQVNNMNFNSNNNINPNMQNMRNFPQFQNIMLNMQNMNMMNMNMNMMNMKMQNMPNNQNIQNLQSNQNMQNFMPNFPGMLSNQNLQNFQNNFINQPMNINSSPQLNQNFNIKYDKEEVVTKVENSNNPFVKGIVFPHPAGLLNVGQSCYMNATIEALSNIKEFSSRLLQKYGSFDLETQPLCLSFSSLLYNLFHTKENYIAPKLFKEIIGKLNPLFEGNHAADAKDLIFFIIETLHKEILGPNKNNSNNEVDFLQQEMNSQDEQKMLNDFLIEYKSNRTFVSNIFYGINRSIMKCFGCGICKYSFQTFNLLIFPLKKVKNYKIKRNGSVKNLDLNLYDAFNCEQEEEKLEGENMIYCNRCRKLSPGSHKQDIYGTPQVLIIILNRGRNNQDFNEEFRFDEFLDFNNNNIVVNQGSYKKYFLCGIITHLGESGSGGHFIAYCRNDCNSGFYCYNDHAVSQVSVIDAMATKISSRDIEKKTPYILLYHYMK